MKQYVVNMTVTAGVVTGISQGSGFIDLAFDDGDGMPSRLYDDHPLLVGGYPAVGDALATFAGGLQQWIPEAIFAASFKSPEQLRAAQAAAQAAQQAKAKAAADLAAAQAEVAAVPPVEGSAS